MHGLKLGLSSKRHALLIFSNFQKDGQHPRAIPIYHIKYDSGIKRIFNGLKKKYHDAMHGSGIKISLKKIHVCRHSEHWMQFMVVSNSTS